MRQELFCFLAFTLAGCGPASAGGFHAQVRVWFAAFIPKQHPMLPDYITKASNGTYVIKAPDFIGPLAGSCFVTDNRLFDPNPGASARIAVNLLINIDGKEMSVSDDPSHPRPRVGPTHNVDCSTGIDISPPKTAPSDRISVGDVVKSDFMRTVYIDAAGANPFYPSVKVPGMNLYLGISPDIDLKITIRYEFLGRRIVVDGTTGYFPSFEGYYSIGGGKTQVLFQQTPYENSTAINLIDFNTGLNTRNIKSTILLAQ